MSIFSCDLIYSLNLVSNRSFSFLISTLCASFKSEISCSISSNFVCQRFSLSYSRFLNYLSAFSFASRTSSNVSSSICVLSILIWFSCSAFSFFFSLSQSHLALAISFLTASTAFFMSALAFSQATFASFLLFYCTASAFSLFSKSFLSRSYLHSACIFASFSACVRLILSISSLCFLASRSCSIWLFLSFSSAYLFILSYSSFCFFKSIALCSANSERSSSICDLVSFSSLVCACFREWI